MQSGHFNRSTLRVGVLELTDWNVGEVSGLELGAGIVTMVSLDADGGASANRLGWTVAEMPACVASFILALVLVGGMYSSSRTQKTG